MKVLSKQFLTLSCDPPRSDIRMRATKRSVIGDLDNVRRRYGMGRYLVLCPHHRADRLRSICWFHCCRRSVAPLVLWSRDQKASPALALVSVKPGDACCDPLPFLRPRISWRPRPPRNADNGLENLRRGVCDENDRISAVGLYATDRFGR